MCPAMRDTLPLATTRTRCGLSTLTSAASWSKRLTHTLATLQRSSIAGVMSSRSPQLRSKKTQTSANPITHPTNQESDQEMELDTTPAVVRDTVQDALDEQAQHGANAT